MMRCNRLFSLSSGDGECFSDLDCPGNLPCNEFPVRSYSSIEGSFLLEEFPFAAIDVRKKCFSYRSSINTQTLGGGTQDLFVRLHAYTYVQRAGSRLFRRALSKCNSFGLCFVLIFWELLLNATPMNSIKTLYMCSNLP